MLEIPERIDSSNLVPIIKGCLKLGDHSEFVRARSKITKKILITMKGGVNAPAWANELLRLYLGHDEDLE